jgi:CheY-like chemotaxis protein
VLVVDDEPAVRAGTQRILEKMGLETLAACNGAEALAVFASDGPTIGLVILDMGMPVLGGAECFDRLRRTSPVPVLISTGYAVDAEAQDLVARGASLIEKPFRAQDLTREVAHLLDLEP